MVRVCITSQRSKYLTHSPCPAIMKKSIEGEKIEGNLQSMPNFIGVDKSDGTSDDDDVIFVEEYPDDRQGRLASQTLKMIVKEYTARAFIYTTIVRPWIEGDPARKPSTNAITQFALYKCMMDECLFASNDMEDFRKHMEMHDQVIDYFRRKKLLDDQTRQRLIKFRACAYCRYSSESNAQLIEHMEKLHRRCIFQCPHCFYRSIDVDNVLLHRRIYHATSCGAILLCGQIRRIEQEDDNILKNADQRVKKIRCGQGNCTMEFACYNHLHDHLDAQHPGKYECPYCSPPTTITNKHTITEHLSSAHSGFEEFQCLICTAGFHVKHGIRAHMLAKHPFNYLVAGVRRSSRPFDDESIGKLQLIYVGESENESSCTYTLAKCSQPDALNAMDPMELIPSQQVIAFAKLDRDVHENQIMVSYKPGILSSTSCDVINYKQYVSLAPLIVKYKCIPDQAINDAHAIESYINLKSQCNDFNNITSMLEHRCNKHGANPIVVLKIEMRAYFRVYTIVNCVWQCPLCDTPPFDTRPQIVRHFFDRHPNLWFAVKILVKLNVIKSNDPKQPAHMKTEPFELQYFSILVCKQTGCNAPCTPAQAIEHHNQKHHQDSIENSTGFRFALCPAFATNVPKPIVQSNEAPQMQLFECHRCKKLFASLSKIEQHFAADCGEFELRRFSMKKLFRCHKDRIIGTFAGIKLHHEAEHPGEHCSPANILLPHLRCGREIYSDALFKSLELDAIDMDQCKYVSGCCANEEKLQLIHIVEHLMKCERRFVCHQCPNRTWSSADSFALHCMEHDNNANPKAIIKRLQNIKLFLPLFNTMQIIMPNGMVWVNADIVNTTIGQKIDGKITEIIANLWKQEKDDIDRMLKIKVGPNGTINTTPDTPQASLGPSPTDIASSLLLDPTPSSTPQVATITPWTQSRSRTRSTDLNSDSDSTSGSSYRSRSRPQSPTPANFPSNDDLSVRSLQCHLCKQTYSSRESLRSHVENQHANGLLAPSALLANDSSAPVETALNGTTRTVSREKMATSSGRKTLSSVSDTVVVETTEQSMINNQRHSNDRIESRPGCYIARRLSTIRVSRTISSCIVNGNANTSMGTSSSNSSCKSSSRSSDVAGIRRKRKNLQSSNLSIMEKRPSRTVKPRDNYDNFRNLLVQTLDKKSENCCSKIQLELWDRLQQHMKNRSTVAPNVVADTGKGTPDSMKPLNETESFANSFMPMLRKYTNPTAMETDIFMMDLKKVLTKPINRAILQPMDSDIDDDTDSAQ